MSNTVLPLHIFEPKYQEMVAHTMENHEFIGIVQPKELEEGIIYSIGCLGKLEQCEQLPNENYMIRLNGIIRFQIMQELQVATQYRQARVNYHPFQQDLNESQKTLEETEKLFLAFQKYSEKKIDRSIVENSKRFLFLI